MFAVSHMKVWRVVLIEIHADHNTKKPAYFGHASKGKVETKGLKDQRDEGRDAGGALKS